MTGDKRGRRPVGGEEKKSSCIVLEWTLELIHVGEGRRRGQRRGVENVEWKGRISYYAKGGKEKDFVKYYQLEQNPLRKFVRGKRRKRM